jgi:hypothetical protein
MQSRPSTQATHTRLLPDTTNRFPASRMELDEMLWSMNSSWKLT